MFADGRCKRRTLVHLARLARVMGPLAHARALRAACVGSARCAGVAAGSLGRIPSAEDQYLAAIPDGERRAGGQRVSRERGTRLWIDDLDLHSPPGLEPE